VEEGDGRMVRHNWTGITGEAIRDLEELSGEDEENNTSV
jgi:hypothetical protein